MRKRRRRGISMGTVCILLLVAGTLSLTAWLFPRLSWDTSDIRVNSQAFLDTLGEAVTLPGLPGMPRTGATAQPILGATPAPGLPLPQVTPSPTPVPTPRVVTLCAVGSIAAPKNVRQSVYDEESRTYDFTPIFEEARGLLTAGDLTLCTVETVFAGKDAGYNDFNAPDELLSALRYAGIDMLSLATERALEQGLDGLRSTVMAMESAGFMVAGAYPSAQDAENLQIFQINDIQIAVLAYSETLSDAGGRKTKKDDRYALPMLEEERVRTDIANARRAGANLVIVMPHWGKKNTSKVDAKQQDWARKLAEMGADIVLGAHPGVVQRVDWLSRGQDGAGRQDTLVAYSLGYFLSDSRDAANAGGVALRIEVEMEPMTGAVRITQCAYAPTWVQRVSSGGKYTYTILRADDALTIDSLDSTTRKNMDKSLKVVQRSMADGAAPAVW